MSHGTKVPEAPVTRAELERAVRHANLLADSLRQDILRLGAQLATLTDQLEGQGIDCADGVEAALPAALEAVQINHELGDPLRVEFGSLHGNKYDAPASTIDCAELLPLCKGRCCSLEFALNTQDLNEGVVRFDYARPYWILQRACDGYCVHNDPETRGCGVYEHRPLPCREFDCRGDSRIWTDFDKRIPAPEMALYGPRDRAEDPAKVRADALDTFRMRVLSGTFEEVSVAAMYGKRETDADGRCTLGPNVGEDHGE